MSMKFQKCSWVLYGAVAVFALGGCARITAVSISDPKEPEGIPYYLPRAYLVVTKNVRYIPAATVGLTQPAPIPNTFMPDAGGAGGAGGGAGGGADGGGGATSKPATKPQGQPIAATTPAKNSSDTKDANSNNNESGNQAAGAASSGGQVFGPPSILVVPSSPLDDGLVPDTFYTYQVLFLPDLTRKYALRINGGAGELRSTENLVNGWMYTGPGPLYMRDSFTASSIAAIGSTASDVAAAIGKVMLPTPSVSSGSKTATKPQGLPEPRTIRNYAEIYVFEQVVDPNDAHEMAFRLVAAKRFDREFVNVKPTSENPGASGAANGADPREQIVDAIVGGITGLAIKDGDGSFRVVDAKLVDKTVEVTLTHSNGQKPSARSMTLKELETQVSAKVMDVVKQVQGGSDLVDTVVIFNKNGSDVADNVKPVLP